MNAKQTIQIQSTNTRESEREKNAELKLKEVKNLYRATRELCSFEDKLDFNWTVERTHLCFCLIFYFRVCFFVFVRHLNALRFLVEVEEIRPFELPNSSFMNTYSFASICSTDEESLNRIK